MTDSAHGGRKISAFEYWLRTGRRAPVQYKFNGWHDPDDGKFTFKGSGNYFGQGSSGGERLTMAQPPKPTPRRSDRGDGSWLGGGFTGGGGGSWGGGGATGPGWETPDERRARERGRVAPATTQKLGAQGQTPTLGAPALQPKAQTQYAVRKGDSLSSIARLEGVTIDQLIAVNSISNPDMIKIGGMLTVPARNGSAPGWVSVQAKNLTFEVDQAGRTRIARGTLGQEGSGRSKTLQAQAGRPDRQPTDDGGHIIASRFGGPRMAYNHFAQDAAFNRGAYRALEDIWAKAQNGGKQVSVRVNLGYANGSRRPDGLQVEWEVGGNRRRTEFANRAGGRHD
jgi:LysM repeat protein